MELMAIRSQVRKMGIASSCQLRVTALIHRYVEMQHSVTIGVLRHLAVAKMHMVSILITMDTSIAITTVT